MEIKNINEIIGKTIHTVIESFEGSVGQTMTIVVFDDGSYYIICED